MLGPAELREIEEALNSARPNRPRPEHHSPYLSPSFAAGVAMARTVTVGLKRARTVPGDKA